MGVHDSASLAPTPSFRPMQLPAANAFRSEAQAMAAALGIKPGRLVRCLLSSLKPREILQCFRSDDPMGCVLEKVDWAKILECGLAEFEGGSDGNGGFDSNVSLST